MSVRPVKLKAGDANQAEEIQDKNNLDMSKVNGKFKN